MDPARRMDGRPDQSQAHNLMRNAAPIAKPTGIHHKISEALGEVNKKIASIVNTIFKKLGLNPPLIDKETKLKERAAKLKEHVNNLEVHLGAIFSPHEMKELLGDNEEGDVQEITLEDIKNPEQSDHFKTFLDLCATKLEAKLRGDLPNLNQAFRQLDENSQTEKLQGGLNSIGKIQKEFASLEKALMSDTERKLKRQITKLDEHLDNLAARLETIRFADEDFRTTHVEGGGGAVTLEDTKDPKEREKFKEFLKLFTDTLEKEIKEEIDRRKEDGVANLKEVFGELAGEKPRIEKLRGALRSVRKIQKELVSLEKTLAIQNAAAVLSVIHPWWGGRLG